MIGIPKVKRRGGRCISTLFILLLGAFISFFQLSSIAYGSTLGIIGASDLNKNASGWIVLDARPKSEWTAGHIPGALSFSWEDYTRTDEQGIPYRVWQPQALAKALGAMGINENTPVVVYGDADKSWGGEGWTCWVLSWLGHKGQIRLLSGGIQSWKTNAFPVLAGAEKKNIKNVRYNVQLDPALDITTVEIEKNRSGQVLVDTRSTLEWFKGRIPGAVHIPWNDFYSGKDRRPLNPDALKKLLQKKGVDARKPIVYYCTGGIRSGYAWMVHQLAGLPIAKNYEGGYEAWQRRQPQ
jgi:thiosulfate/3-mercaptopyruvate sulfurtransferase